jgi:hypothetical protein
MELAQAKYNIEKDALVKGRLFRFFGFFNFYKRLCRMKLSRLLDVPISVLL